MHAQGLTNYDHFKACRAYETALELKREGKIRHFGISFHDRAEVLEQILGEYPEIEVVQIQFNYLDYEDPAVQSCKCYEVCVQHGKPVIVMEPVKGGKLVDLPEEARAVLDGMHGGSPASYAIRFAAGFPGDPDGALRHEQYGADAGQPLVHAGFPAAERGRACRSEAGAGDLPQQTPHPLHRLPLLYGRLSEAHRHPRPLRHHELQAAPPPLERGFLL